MERKLITRNDIFLIIFLCVVISLCFVFKKTSETDLIAEIYFDGEIIDTVNLTEREEKRLVTGENNSVVICAEDGKIRFENSSCPDKICVQSGELENNGDFASCLPEKVVIKVTSEKKTEIDAIVY